MNKRKKQIAIKRDPAEALTLWVALNNVTRGQVKDNDEFYSLASLAAEIGEFFQFTEADAEAHKIPTVYR